MFSKISTSMALLPFLGPVLAADVSGYLGNACNSEQLYFYTTKTEIASTFLDSK